MYTLIITSNLSLPFATAGTFFWTNQLEDSLLNWPIGVSVNRVSLSGLLRVRRENREGCKARGERLPRYRERTNVFGVNKAGLSAVGAAHLRRSSPDKPISRAKWHRSTCGSRNWNNRCDSGVANEPRL